MNPLINNLVEMLIQMFLYDLEVMSNKWMYIPLFIPIWFYVCFFLLKWSILLASLWLPLRLAFNSRLGK